MLPEQYEAYKHNIKTGDLIAWRTNGVKSLADIIPNIVSYGTKSPFYHVGTAYVVGGRYFVVEAMPLAVRIYPLSLKPAFIHYPVDIEHTEEMEKELMLRVGEPYSLWNALLTAFKSTTATPSKPAWQCALLYRWYLQSSGKEVPTLSTPGEVVEFVAELNGHRWVDVTKS